MTKTIDLSGFFGVFFFENLVYEMMKVGQFPFYNRTRWLKKFDFFLIGIFQNIFHSNNCAVK